MRGKKNIKKFFERALIAFLLAFALNLSFVLAEAKFEITSFSCSPSELIQGSIFSCSVQIQNTGDAAATLSTSYLYTDANNWLESSVYTQSYGSSIAVGETVSITFVGLKSTKAGVYGFSKIVMDNIEGTDYVSTTKVKIIDIIVTVNNSVSSSAMNGSFTSTATVVAGGNIDVILTFTVNSGGCSIENQSSQKTMTGLQSGNIQSRTWTVMQGSSGDCKFTISAAATGSGTKVDSTPSQITCTNCPSGGGGSSGSGGGGGSGSSGGGSIGNVYIVGELTGSQEKEIAKNDRIKFNISNIEHKLTLKNLTESEATITIESRIQTFIIPVGTEMNIDLNNDNSADINIRLKSISLLTKKAKFILTKISGGVPATGEKISEGNVSEEEEKQETKTTSKAKESSLKYWITGILILIVIAVIVFIMKFLRKKYR